MGIISGKFDTLEELFAELCRQNSQILESQKHCSTETSTVREVVDDIRNDLAKQSADLARINERLDHVQANSEDRRISLKIVVEKLREEMKGEFLRVWAHISGRDRDGRANWTQIGFLLFGSVLTVLTGILIWKFTGSK